MYVKLILRNARRSVRDYLIYMVTLTVCVTLFYSFLSISSASYDPKLDVSYDITMLSDGMKLAICLVTFLILFLIRYVNRFMLQRRQKEFAVQSVMGMEQRTIGRLFFAETLIMGMASVAAGILLGMVCSQFITAMLLADFGQPYRFTWMLYPDTVLLTVIVFLASFLAVGFWNARTIRKLPLIEMLYAERQNEPKVSSSKFMPVLTVLYLLALLWALESGIVIRHFYFDPRYPFPVHILFGGNILFPALAVLLAAAWGIAAVIRRRRRFFSFHALMKTEMVLALFCGIWAAGVPMLRNAYWLPYDANVMNQYLLFLALHLFYVICGLLFLSAEAVSAWKDRSPEHRYRGENLFFLGQIISRLRSGAKTMTVVCSTMILSVCLFLAVPVLSGWAYGYLDERSVFDVQMNSFYNDVIHEEDLPDTEYPEMGELLKDRGIQVTYDRTFSMYLPEQETFYDRIKWEFPVMAMALSDYNAVREMLGYPAVSLEEDEFTTQWQSLAEKEEREEFLAGHREIHTDAGTLRLAEEDRHAEVMGESVYNLYTDLIYVFPDRVCEKLLPVTRNRYIQTEEAISYQDAREMERELTRLYPEEGKGGVRYSLDFQTLQVNSLIGSMFILKATMIYSAVVLLIICLTVLALQQLADAARQRQRFQILRRLGVEERSVGRLILKQLGFWFGLPIGIAAVVSTLLCTCFLKTVSAQITAYIGAASLLIQLAAFTGILILLLGCYFLSTWLLFRRAVDE